MKRALAERAKQQGGPGVVSTSAPDDDTAGSRASSPPLKIPRLTEPTVAVRRDGEESTATTTTTPAPAVPQTQSSATPAAAGGGPGRIQIPPPSTARRPSSSPKPTMKRQRSSQAMTTTDDDESSSFYLKHQNRALSSELKSLQYQMRLLEKERDTRRSQCRQAIDALYALNQSWTEMEVTLMESSGRSNEESSSVAAAEVPGTDSMSRSTGVGDSVELVNVLKNSLTALATVNGNNNGSSNENTATATQDLSHGAAVLSKRVATLQEWIQKALTHHATSAATTSTSTTADDDSHQQRIAALHGQAVSLRSQLQDAETRIAELAVTKDEAVESDRRVRRGLYRLAAGRMQLPEVLKAVELEDDNTMAAMAEAEEMEQQGERATSSKAVKEEEGSDQREAVDVAQVAQVKKQLQDVEEIASSRENQIAQLLQERESLLKRINGLSVAKVGSSDAISSFSDEDIRRSSLYTETATQLATASRQLNEVRSKLQETLEKYATVKGDADLATKTLEDHLSKFQKRWMELTGDNRGENGNGEADTNDIADPEVQAKRIVELEHKLKQALENVRQADTVRTSLEEAHRMNDFLQGKLEEFKVKNAALVANKSAARSSSDLASLNTPSSKTPTHIPLSAERSEKLQKEHRRMKKELAAALLSKENAKEKQLRAEKERDSLMKTNSRLIKQSAEKDDMNAKSLSTILHLKHMTEQLTTEKGLLEQQSKSAEQLALASRLATNAKDRVSEELLKEQDALTEKIKGLEQQCDGLQHARETAEGALSQTKAEMANLKQSASQATGRCEELAAESTKQEEEKQKLMETLAVSQREASEASSKIGQLRKSQGAKGGAGAYSGFTQEELIQFLTMLKGRVTCGVCNEREKNVMIMRCRHMFCKECIDENIKNRNRKCPACGQRFDTKDVEDVWV